MSAIRIMTLAGPRYYQKGTSIWAETRMALRKKFPQRVTKPIQIPMDTSGFAIPKPSASAKQQPKDGRLVESPSRYSQTKQAMWRKQNQRCVNLKSGKECGKFMPTPAWGHRHHLNGRGIGGGKRDDAETILICIECHLEAHC
jgi:hypothetical protein